MNVRNLATFGKILGTALALLLSSSLMAAWQVVDFDVYEGWLETNKFTVVGEVPAWPEKSLSPELRQEIQAYLNQVALELQKQFPAPSYRNPVKRDDGVVALRVYYYDFEIGSDLENAYAVYQSSESCETEREFIALNARFLTQNGKLTQKAYIDMAHELFHAVQASMPAWKQNCNEPNKWVIEGQAEAIAHELARKLRGIHYSNKQIAFGLRNYAAPLNVERNYQSDFGFTDQNYQTSSFWRYLAERRHSGSLPGPDYFDGYGTDYSFIVELMAQPVPESGEIFWLENYLTTYFRTSLKRLLPEFLAVFADYPRYRFDGSADAEGRAKIWRDFAFADSSRLSAQCKKLTLPDIKSSAETNLYLEPMAAQCLDIEVGEVGAPLTWTVQVTADTEELLRQVRIAAVGGQQLAISSSFGANGPRVSTAADFILLPGQTESLLFANVNSKPHKTKMQTINVHLSLDLAANNMAPKPSAKPSSHVRSTGPGPAGADETRKRYRAMANHQQAGSGTVELSRQRGGECRNCNGKTELSLSVSPQFQIARTDASQLGGYDQQMMSFAVSAFQNPMAFVGADTESPGQRVRIRMPEIEYGFNGTLTGVEIKVPGYPEELAALDPVPEYPQEPCVWGEPTGVVTIEEFTPLILKGSYRAALVTTTIPRDNRNCPTKPVVHQLEGRFTVSAPWMSDPDRPIDMHWLAEDQGVQLPPAEESFVSEHSDSAASEVNMAGFVQAMEADTEVDPDACDCSCGGFKKAFEASKRVMFSGDGATTEDRNLMQCSGYCMADAIKAGCDIGY